MDREWLYQRIDSLGVAVLEMNKLVDIQTRLIEDLNDRVAGLEECARLAPTRAARRSRNQEGESAKGAVTIP